MPIKILGVITEKVGRPSGDPGPGGAAYPIPLKLSSSPPSQWSQMFIKNWENPSSGSPGQPGSARISGDHLVLQTSMEDLESQFLPSLKVVLSETNEQYGAWEQKQARRQASTNEAEEAHRKKVEDIARRLKFD